jgi:hypothetical protein
MSARTTADAPCKRVELERVVRVTLQRHGRAPAPRRTHLCLWLAIGGRRAPICCCPRCCCCCLLCRLPLLDWRGGVGCMIVALLLLLAVVVLGRRGCAVAAVRGARLPATAARPFPVILPLTAVAGVGVAQCVCVCLCVW